MYTLSLKTERPVISPQVPLSAVRLISGNREESPQVRFVFTVERAMVLSRLLQVMRCLDSVPVLDITHNGSSLVLGLAIVLRVDESGAARVFGNGSHLFASENDIVLKVSAPLSFEDEGAYLSLAGRPSSFTVIALELVDSCGREVQLWAGEAPMVVHAPHVCG